MSSSSYQPLKDTDDSESTYKIIPLSPQESTAHHLLDNSNKPTGKFCNPWPSWQGLSLGDIYKAYQKGATFKPPPEADEEETQEDHGRLVKVVYPDWEAEPLRGSASGSGGGKVPRAKVCWVGHAGMFVQLPWTGEEEDVQVDGGVGILFDPIFSKRCSPVQWFGPSRFLPAPCRVSDLPRIHICFISHDHYDHLDYNTIMELYRLNGESIHFYVPLGLKKWFLSCHIPSTQIIELDWHQESLIRIPHRPNFRDSLGYPPDRTSFTMDEGEDGDTSERDVWLKIIFTPAQHRSGRGLFDHWKSLWGSWVVGVVAQGEKVEQPGFREQDGFKMFFAGDTGYRYAGAPEAEMEEAICPAFQDIANRYGPIDLAFLPISTGSSLSFLRSLLGITLHHYTITSSQHLNAWDAIQISKMMGAKATLAIHHSTFSPEDESRGCIYEFGKTTEAEQVSTEWGKDGCFKVSDIGEVLYL